MPAGDGRPSRVGRPTLATVAASAGVSIATVSKVVNGRTDVGPATRARIEQLLKEHDYVGAAPGGRPVERRPTVELVFEGKLNAYGAEIIQGVLEAAPRVAVAVATSLRPRGHQHAPQERLTAWARELAGSGRRAVIAVVNDLTAGDLAALARARLPLVVIDPLNMPHARVTSVGSTNFAGGLVATQHLLGLGHRRIAFVGGPLSAACNQARMHGFRAAMEAEEVAGTRGVRAVRALHVRRRRRARGARARPARPADRRVRCQRRDGRRSHRGGPRPRPADPRGPVSVVGFDDTQVARFASPPLTTVRQPLREMGGVALRTALRLAAGEQLESHHVELATELVVRGSTAPPSLIQ